MNILYQSPFDQQYKVLQNDSKKISLEHLKELILYKENLPRCIDFNIILNGKKITDNLFIDNSDVFIQICLSLIGGKGGFGSMLRAIGAQIEKTTNREACRDLSGRRLRDVNEEKRIKEWIKKKAQRKEEEKKKKEKLKHLAEGTISSNCNYDDKEFEKFRTEIPDMIEESINYGLQQQQGSQQQTDNLKRKLEIDTNSSSNNKNDEGNTPEPPNKKLTKKHNLWLGIEVDSSSDSDDDIEQKKNQEKQAPIKC